MFRQAVWAMVLGIGVMGTGCEAAQEHLHGHFSDATTDQPHAGSADVTVNLQGDDTDWWSNPYTYAFYGVAVAAFANGPDEVDETALQAAFMQVARDFAQEMGLDPAMMQDHLKLIPGQLIEIVREDPSVLDNYENLIFALRGPA